MPGHREDKHDPDGKQQSLAPSESKRLAKQQEPVDAKVSDAKLSEEKHAPAQVAVDSNLNESKW